MQCVQNTKGSKACSPGPLTCAMVTSSMFSLAYACSFARAVMSLHKRTGEAQTKANKNHLGCSRRLKGLHSHGTSSMMKGRGGLVPGGC